MTTRTLSPQAEARAAARRTQRTAQRRVEAEQAARRQAAIDTITARWARRCPGLDRKKFQLEADRIVELRWTRDRLAYRTDDEYAGPDAYRWRGWRADMPRHLAYLFGDCGRGLPLAAEGGEPFHCADRVTAELACANYLARRRAEQEAVAAPPRDLAAPSE